MSLSSKDTATMSWGLYAQIMTDIRGSNMERATNNFADENLLKQGSVYKVYKGQFLHSDEIINIVVRTCPRDNYKSREILLSRYVKHKNIVSTFKFAFRDNEVMIANIYEANGSLDKHLSAPTLTWMQRLHICVGVANALKYLYNDAEDKNHYIIHGNIKSSNILLDNNWEPKLNDFTCAIIAEKHHLYLTNTYKGSLQHMDPAYVNTKGLTHKSDIFSFGVLLFEVLFGKEAFIQNDDKWYFARLARSHYENSTLDALIDPDLRKQMNLQPLNIFAEIAYYCLKEQRSDRPDISQVILKLEKASELQQKHEHPTAASVESTSSNYTKVILQEKSLSHLKLRLTDIESATDNFSEACCIGSGGFGKVYKAKLDYFDDNNLLVAEGKNEGVLTKKNGIVAIKQISSRVDEQGEQGFLAEIEMLSKCRHPNIVSLLGFCDEGSNMILVYEYVPNGSLDHYLSNADNLINLTWAQRIQICIDIAHGLQYLHTRTKDGNSIIHRDVKSANILLGDNWVAKIADFGLSKLHGANQQGSTLVTNHIAGTDMYLDPEYASSGRLKTKSDIYSFGVVMFEIVCGKLAYDITYNEKGLPSVARQYFKEGKLKNLVDQKIRETDEYTSMITGGINQYSLDTFLEVAYQCLAETQSDRPTMEVIIKELEKALKLQNEDNLHISLEDIKLGTQNFNDSNCIGEERFWKLYEGSVAHADGRTPIFAKRWDKSCGQGHMLFLKELGILYRYKHENIVTLAGYCNEMDENIIVYEYASNGRLDKYLCDPSLTWMKRLKICLDVAKGLEFLHESHLEHSDDSMSHRDIRSASILLDSDWKAKITNFDMSRNIYNYASLDDTSHYSLGYVDPDDIKGNSSQFLDIYSLGVVLLEMLCGRLAWTEGCKDHSQSLGPLAIKHYMQNDNLDEMIFKGIKEQMAPRSKRSFSSTAVITCLDYLRWRHTIATNASTVVRELKEALEFQEDYEIWEPKLPVDYEEIIRASKTPEIYHSGQIKKNLYHVLSKGILHEDGKVFFSLGSNGEKNEMISARMFSYKNRKSLKWRSVHESRFLKAAKMRDISNLNIRIKITTRYLSPGVNYGAYIIFKVCDIRKFSSKPMYVNLKYTKAGENLHAYFATWRDDKWMMIEVCQFLCDKKDTHFDVLLESFSQYYCGYGPIYIEGIEFRVIDNIKNEDAGEIQQILKSNSNKDQLSSLSEVSGKKHLMLSAKEVLYDSSNIKHFHLQPSPESRFQEVIELLPQQVFRINCKIQSQMLSQYAEYLCYLVFKLSEKCHGLHCPVKVRNLLHRNNKQAEVIYFRSPRAWNLNENNSVPEQREDGWMEVKVWKFNANHQLKNGCIPVNLKLITYEGTMSGLILCGLEFRSM